MTPLAQVASLVIAASLTVSILTAKIKKDVVVMKNGDTFTGEIKKIENGFLYFKAAYMAATVQLDWREVDRLESKDPFTVVLTNGLRDSGIVKKLPPSEGAAEDFLVQSPGSGTSARTSEVVTVTPTDESVWQRLNVSVNYGFTYTGGTSTTQSNFSGDVIYQSEKWSGKLDGSSVFSRQNGAKDSGRNTVNLYYDRYFGQRWFIAGTAGFLNSQQQDLTARTTVGGGIGLDVLRRSTSSLQLIGGALLSEEKYSPESGSKAGTGADSQFLVQYTKYAFTKFQFTTQFAVFPSLSTPGRVRIGLQSYLKRELFKNFNVVFSVYENYDSQPPVVAPKNDFGTSTSLGWTFP